MDILEDALAAEDATIVTATQPGRRHIARLILSLLAFAALVATAAFLVAVAW